MKRGSEFDASCINGRSIKGDDQFAYFYSVVCADVGSTLNVTRGTRSEPGPGSAAILTPTSR